MIPDYEISLATTDNVQGMLALQEVNLPDKGGSLSVRLTVDWFNAAVPQWRDRMTLSRHIGPTYMRQLPT